MASSPSRASISQPPTTPKTPKAPSKVKIPKSATVYSITASDPDLRTQINQCLINEGHIEKVQTALTHALSAHTSNWPALIRSHALALLRSGECTTFPTLMDRVLQDIKTDTDNAKLNNALDSTAINSRTIGPNPNTTSSPSANNSNSTSSPKTTTSESSSQDSSDHPNSDDNHNSTRDKGKGREVDTRRTGSEGSLALPKSVVEDGIKVTRECLKDIVIVDG